jgi:hypothetical protein
MRQFRTLAGSYALHALDEADVVEFESHLASCRICQDEVAEFRQIAAQLSWLTLATPPCDLRTRSSTRSTPLGRLHLSDSSFTSSRGWL